MKRMSMAMALLTAMMPQQPSLELLQHSMNMAAGLPNKSRGKGRGAPTRNFLRGSFNNKYMPHQGKKECARRMKQMGFI